MKKSKVALIVGHDVVEQGAIAGSLTGYHSVIGGTLTEYNFNTKLAFQINTLSVYEDFLVKVFIRQYIERDAGGVVKSIRNVYKHTDEWGADCTVECHFNSYGDTDVAGFEFLSSGSQKSLALAEAFKREFTGSFHYRKDRGVKIPKKGKSGYINLMAGKAPAIIAEPFFGSCPEEVEWARLVGIQALGLVYVNAIRTALKFIVEQEIA